MTSPEPSAVPAPAAPPAPRRRRWRRLALGLAALALLYTAFGFLLAPRLVRSAIEERGSAALKRPVTVAAVEINPLILTVTVRGLAVAEPGGGQLLGWETLYVRLAPWKALAGDVGLAELVLTRPSARLGLDATGRLNIQDLVDGDPAAPAPAKEEKQALGLALDRLEVLEARLVFTDETRAPRFESTLGPLTVRLSSFRTRGGTDSPYAFSGSTEAGETFSWSGTLLSEPLRSSGVITFGGVALPKYGAYQRDAAPALAIRSGTLGLTTRYHLEWGATRVATLAGLEVAVDDLVLARHRDQSVAVTLPRLEVKGGEVDLLGRVASISEVKVQGGQLTPRRDADGAMAIVEMLELAAAPPPRPADQAKAAPSPAAPPAQPAGTPGPGAAAQPAWRWKVGALSVEKVAVEAEDLVPAQGVRVSLPEVSLRLTGLSQQRDVACPLTASLRIGQAGTLKVEGTVWPFAARADLVLTAAGLDLAPLAPYLEGKAPARLTEARLGFTTRVTVDAAGAEPAWTLAGDVTLDGLRLRHPSREEELVRWTSLAIGGIEAASAGRRASVKVVRLVEPRLRGVIFEDGTTGMGPPAAKGDAQATPGAGPAKPSGPVAGAPPAPAQASGHSPPVGGPAWKSSLALFEVVRGRLSFVDRSVTPPVLLTLSDVAARITDLSSDPRVRSSVDLRAKVDGAAPLTVTGTVNPLQAAAFTDLRITSKGIDLTPLDPYTGKFLGYGLQKGKLDLDLSYRVKARALAAENLVRLDQFTLGAETKSPDATGAPVRLGLALLKDRDGVILLDLPIEGDLDDPEFRYGKVVWRAVLNVLVKVATSPFSALASLVGGSSEDISLVEFAPGEAALDEAAQRRLSLLVTSLAQRPGLALELEGTADPASDGRALRRAALEARLQQVKAAGRGPSPGAGEAAAFSPEERPALVAAAWRAAFPPPPPPPAGPPAAPAPTPAAMEEQLLAAELVPPEALKALAVARGAVARDALLAAGLDPSRLFTVEGGDRATKEPGARAYFTVR